MPREFEPLKRQKSNKNVTINIGEIFRNPDIQNQVIKECKKLKKSTK